MTGPECCYLEKFHVTKPGNHTMIALPYEAAMDDPFSGQLYVEATFAQLNPDDSCEDLLIRTLTIEGTALGTIGPQEDPRGTLTKLIFNVGTDIFNDTSAHEYTYTMVRSMGTAGTFTKTDERHLYENIPQCFMSTPRGYIKKPTYRTFMHRQRFKQVECDLSNGQHVIKVFWSTVWRGLGSDGESVFANDLSFSISNVEGAAGILGLQDHANYSEANPDCNKTKKQPIMGPYQTRNKPKGRPHHRHHFR
jgi:hypothetical protein